MDLDLILAEIERRSDAAQYDPQPMSLTFSDLRDRQILRLLSILSTAATSEVEADRAESLRYWGDESIAFYHWGYDPMPAFLLIDYARPEEWREAVEGAIQMVSEE